MPVDVVYEIGKKSPGKAILLINQHYKPYMRSASR